MGTVTILYMQRNIRNVPLQILFIVPLVQTSSPSPWFKYRGVVLNMQRNIKDVSLLILCSVPLVQLYGYCYYCILYMQRNTVLGMSPPLLLILFSVPLVQLHCFRQFLIRSSRLTAMLRGGGEGRGE